MKTVSTNTFFGNFFFQYLHSRIKTFKILPNITELLSTDFGIDPGNGITWSTIEVSTLTSFQWNHTTTKATSPTYRPTRPTRRTTTRPTTTKPTTKPPNPPSTDSGVYTEGGNGGSVEWSSSPAATSTYQPDVNNVEERFKVVCYFTNWAWYR